MQFETLKEMLVGYVHANIPAPDLSDSHYIPIREWKHNEQGFDFQTAGKTPEDYETWIYPHSGSGGNTSYLGLRVERNGTRLRRITLRAAAYSADRTYELKFNFSRELPALEMRQGCGANVTGERVHFQRVRCVDLLVLDLLELMLPPQIKAHRPEIYLADWGNKRKPCIACGASIRNNWTVCALCRPIPTAMAK